MTQETLEVREPGFASRTVDVLASSALLVVTAPLLLALWCAVRLSSPGPALFRHERVGHGGRPFDVFKFRTLRLGTPPATARDRDSYKISLDSPDVTRVGRLLRRSGLDELPQLFNVLRGDMALIGIRPMVAPELAAEPDQFRELYVRFRPGVSGLWQVKGRIAHVEHTGRTEHDIEWSQTRTLLGDVWLMLRTPMAMVRGCTATAHQASHAERSAHELTAEA